MPSKKDKPPKRQSLMLDVRRALERGQFLDTSHSSARGVKRAITRPEMLYVLKNGRHEPSKDKYELPHEDWNYSVRGKTVDKRDLRIIVSFEEGFLILVTAIELGVKGGD